MSEKTDKPFDVLGDDMRDDKFVHSMDENIHLYSNTSFFKSDTSQVEK